MRYSIANLAHVPGRRPGDTVRRGWLRRKLRCVRLKQCKRAKPIADFLVKHGVPARRAWLLALAGKGWWRRSASPPANEAMTLRWFGELGLVSLQAHHAALQAAGNRRVR